MIIAQLMGAPLADADRLGSWANLIQGQFDPVKVATMLPELERASEEFVDYTRALIDARRDDPQQDLISELITAVASSARAASQSLSGSDPPVRQCHHAPSISTSSTLVGTRTLLRSR